MSRLPRMIRDEVLTYFGRVCVCPGCGESRVHALQLDHKHGSGNVHRKLIKRQGSSFYREVAKYIAAGDQQWLDQFQIYCQRCNLSKHAGTACTLTHGVMSPNGEMAQQVSEVLMDKAADATMSSNGDESADPLEMLNTRVPRSIKRWLQNQGCSNLGEAVTRLVQEKQGGELTILRELKALRAEIQAMTVASTRDEAPQDPPVSTPDPYAYRYGRTSDESPPVPPDPDPALRRSWLNRWASS